MKWKLFLLTPVLVFILRTAIAQSSTTDFRVVGYYSLNSAMNRSKNVPFKLLTHINLWFLNPDSLGNYSEDLSALDKFVAKAHRKNVKVLFSIAGGGSHPYYHKLLQPENRTLLIQNLVSLVVKYNLDGVDVDLEDSDIDNNYESFVVELAKALRSQNKMITAAIAVYYKDFFSDKALAQYDFVNIMVYDRTGPWRPENPGQHSSYENAVEDLEYFGMIRNISGNRMVVGVPFYGYGFGPELTSPVSGMNYKEIVAQFPGAEKADQWNMPDGKIMYYNGIPTIEKKTTLAKEKASGIMIWQIEGDARGRKSLLKAINKVGFKKK